MKKSEKKRLRSRLKRKEKDFVINHQISKLFRTPEARALIAVTPRELLEELFFNLLESTLDRHSGELNDDIVKLEDRLS